MYLNEKKDKEKKKEKRLRKEELNYLQVKQK